MLRHLLPSLLLLSNAAAFSRYPCSFTGRASSVASRAELTTELSCPPSIQPFRKGSSMSMPPFLKKLGLKKPNDDKDDASSSPTAASTDDEKENLLSQIKSAGAAGAISLFIWEFAFWAISIPVAIFGFVSVSGSWPDLSDKEDLAKVGAEAFAFANVARLALPVRIGLAVTTTPWVKENIVEAPWAERFFNKEEAV
eukprot:CAMPEP_0172490888 /NCGR_PEP_ID=MMETSP1066-20121228/21497_1 /TAXON_ID=671091 /ORGANISM="Coscinodiscus wailesii, Strain CCMP2513" /LENGTH=196 /DNA_ID=CAMNT_0013259607 /DNA_START=95 /DNA_END=685 /DNA_ORIENTATION=+